VYPRAMPELLPVRCSRLVGPEPDGVRVLAESGVLSVEELLGVRFLSPGVEVFRGTLEPKPTGVGRMPRAPDLMLLDRRTLEPRRHVGAVSAGRPGAWVGAGGEGVATALGGLSA